MISAACVRLTSWYTSIGDTQAAETDVWWRATKRDTTSKVLTSEGAVGSRRCRSKQATAMGITTWWNRNDQTASAAGIFLYLWLCFGQSGRCVTDPAHVEIPTIGIRALSYLSELCNNLSFGSVLRKLRHLQAEGVNLSVFWNSWPFWFAGQISLNRCFKILWNYQSLYRILIPIQKVKELDFWINE